MSKNKLNIQKFIIDFFENIGAVVERVSYAYVEILLPEDYVTYFDNRQELALAFDPEAAEEKNAEFITIGSPLLDKVIDLIISQKKVLKRHVILDYVRLPAEPLRLINNTFTFYKCRTHEIEQRIIEEHHYLGFVFEINLTSDEKEKYLEKVFIDMYKGQVVEDIEVQLGNALYEQKRQNIYPVPSFITLDKAFNLGLKSAEEIADNRKKTFTDKLEKYRQKELKQVKQFYRKKSQELKRKFDNLKKKDVQNKDEKLNRLRQKLKANTVNKKRRLNDIKEKYSCAVEITPDSLLDYTIPRISTILSLQKKKDFHRLEFLFNPLTRLFEPLICNNCGREITEIYLNDGHPYCNQCSD